MPTPRRPEIAASGARDLRRSAHARSGPVLEAGPRSGRHLLERDLSRRYERRGHLFRRARHGLALGLGTSRGTALRFAFRLASRANPSEPRNTCPRSWLQGS